MIFERHGNSSFLPSPTILTILVLLLLTCCYSSINTTYAQTATIRGFVRSDINGEALQYVNVQLDDFADQIVGSVTDGDGFFLFSRIEPGRYRLRASFIGFAPYSDTLTVAANERLIVNIDLQGQAVEMDEISVETEREGGAANVTAGLQSVQAQDIELVPAPDVSGDLVSYLTTIPGIVTQGARGGQLFIRGGEPTQNLTLLDGMEIYQPFHVLGFYSAFSSDIVSRADVYAGGFGSKYNGRISSVIDVYTRYGNKKAIGASASISPFTGSAHIEGPLMKDRVSFLAVARLSTLDQIATQYIDAPLPFTFNDFFGKIHASIGENSQLSVTGLTTYDNGSLNPENDIFNRQDEIRWRNTAVGMRYLVAPRSLSILSEILISYSELQSEFGPPEVPTRLSKLGAANIAVNMTNYAGLSEVNWGFFFRTPATDTELDGLFQNLIVRRYLATSAGAYIEPDIHLFGGLYIRPGLSVQAYGRADTSYEPRIRLKYDIGIHHFSGAAGIYRQQIVGLSDRRDATNIFTAWIEAPRNEATSATHTLLGYRVEPHPLVQVSIEGFYKYMKDLNVGEWTAFPSFTTRLQEAHGDATGFDLRIELRHPVVYGFLNYGYSSTKYEIDNDDPAFNNPGSYRPPHDRRHQINALLATTIKGFDLSLRWQFGSGLPFTQVVGFDGFLLLDGAIEVDEVRGFPRVIYESIPYRSELPSYHRLDASIDRVFKLGLRTNLTVHASVINVYNRRNLFTLDLLTAQRSDQLPIIPVLGIKLELK